MVKLDEIFCVINGIAATGLKEHNAPFESSVIYVRPASTQARTFRSYIDKSNISKDKIFPEGTLFVSTNGEGSHSYAYVSTCEIVPNSDVSVLIPKIEMSLEEKLYYSQCITANRYKFSYGRKPKGKKLKSILLPTLEDIPEWVKNIDVSRFDNAEKPRIENKSDSVLYIEKWKAFTLGELFEIKKGKRLTKANMTEGSTPFIGSTDSNNGLTNFVGQEAIHKGNVISLNYNGSVGEAFYQPNEFWASDDVNVLYPREGVFNNFNQYIALFIIPVIKKNKFKFSYGRKWHTDRMKESKIVLPEKNGKPDIEYMEKYISSMPYSGSI